MRLANGYNQTRLNKLEDLKYTLDNSEDYLQKIFKDYNQYLSDDGRKINVDLNDDRKKLLLQYLVTQKTQLAHMGEYVISTEEKPIIGTSALDTCYGMVLYDRERKFGIVGHGYESNAIPLLEEIIDIFPKYPNQVVEYAIIPGYRTEERKDRKITDRLLEIMKKVPNAKHFQGDLGVQVGKHLYYEFAFDVRTGQSRSSEVFYDTIKDNDILRRK